MRLSEKSIAVLCGAAIVAVCSAPQVKAEPLQYTLVIHGASHHGAAPDGYKFNQVNPGAAIKLSLNSDWSVQAGGYRNSYYKSTAYAVAQYTPLRIGDVSLGAFAGLASGYSHVSQLNVGKASVVAGLYAVAQLDKINVAMRVVPKTTPKQAYVAAFEVGYSFN